MMNQPPKAAAEGAAHACTAGRPLRDRGDLTADLHMHSTFSDGVKTPAELCRMARKAQLDVIALCDHDTAAGQAEMAEAAKQEGLVLIPGVEVSTGEGGNVHVLGYGKAVLSDGMKAYLHSVASDRVNRARKMMECLAHEGLCIPPEKRDELLANPGVGRPHIARALLELGAASTVKQAFDRYLARGRCGYVARQLPSTGEAVRTLRELGALPVLAHPQLIGLEGPALGALLTELKGFGLMGLEAYHPSVHPGDARQLDLLARQYGLLVTGGSDYHGDPASTIHIGRLPAGWQNRRGDILALLEATQR